MRNSPILDGLLSALPTVRDLHGSNSELYALLTQVARREIEELFHADALPQGFGPFGEFTFPYETMGNVDSLCLFNLDELILFSFYWRNRRRYRRVLDGGANIGLHAIVLSRCGFDVRSYEPDPSHFRLLEHNLALNDCERVSVFNAAISRQAGTLEFVRVLGNTTSSHLAGSKSSPYGELERFPVRVEAIRPLLEWADLAKLDVEGHEAEILLGTTRNDWLNTDCVAEIGSPANARAVFDHFLSCDVGMFSQKTGWRRVEDFAAMPLNYREGSIFISCKDDMPWDEPLACEQLDHATARFRHAG